MITFIALYTLNLYHVLSDTIFMFHFKQNTSMYRTYSSKMCGENID